MSKGVWLITKIVILITIAILGLFYVNHFHDALQNEEWLNVDGFTRIAIPDTFLYLQVIEHDNVFLSILLSGVKNTIGPSLLWIVAGYDWYFIFLLNFIFLNLTAYYMERILTHHNIQVKKSRMALLAFLATPMILYYSIGALKEIPMMLLLTANYYYYIKNSPKIVLILSVILITFRYQIAALFVIIFLAHKIKNNKLRSVFLILLLASAFFPLFSFLNIFSTDAVEIFREDSERGDSIGSFVETVRRDYYILSMIAIMFRIFQSLFEPIIVFMRTLSFFENGALSVIHFVELISLFILIPYLISFFKNFYIALKGKKILSEQVTLLYSFAFSYVFLVGGFSFIQHRYLIPIFPILILAAIIFPDEKKKRKI